MKLYAFSDFHLSGDPPTKPMDIFGENWKNHREKIVNAWKETIREDDAVIMAGDLSWEHGERHLRPHHAWHAPGT